MGDYNLGRKGVVQLSPEELKKKLDDLGQEGCHDLMERVCRELSLHQREMDRAITLTEKDLRVIFRNYGFFPSYA